MQIKIGAPVLAEDGQVGAVERIILRPETGEVQAVVAVDGRVVGRDMVIPSALFLAADEDGLRIRGTLAEVDELEPFAQSQYVDPPEDWLPPEGGSAAFYLFPASPLLVGAFHPPTMQPDAPPEEVDDLQPGEVEVSGATTVFCTDGEAGRLDRVATEGDSDRVLALVVRTGGLSGRDVQVPVDAVQGIGDAGIHLSLSREQLDEMPEYVEEGDAGITP